MIRRPLKWRRAAPAVLFLLFIQPAAAIVNVEDLRIKAPEPGFSGRLAFAASGQTGNTDKSAASVGARVQWHRESATDFMVFNYDSSKTDGVRNTKKGFLHARHIGYLSDRRAWEAFGQVEENEFTRLSSRSLVGGGARLTLLKDKDDKVALITGLGVFYSREKLEPRAGTTDAGTETLWRGNFYLVVKYKLNETVRVISTTYFQPATNDFDDYRALERAALQVKLNDRLDLKLTLDIARDNQPPQLIKKTDTTYRTGVEYRF